ncbi:MAG: M23 family metallopeptidase [Verrucomicrobia bacterium]|nr:M23 family metallopeptidase [Verrucomicrobiota bacterium]MBU1734058.1 M23 family metallopeptidase [Verrucomicrobiota bacterium]MBU1855732.1 M23 family metallopeptidase [Verrucomicrobiota bacterium]
MKLGDNSRRYGAIALLVIFELVFVGLVLYLCFRAKQPGPPDAESETPGLDLPLIGRPAINPFRYLVFPTDQVLDRNDPDVFQPTASGRPESALFGSVRTASYGKGLAASFHEGVDIAAGQRDAAGRPQDAVYAVADGAVAYVNTKAGNSNYGKYVVLTHACPSGMVYTLYAHLAALSPSVIRGQCVKAGDVLGIIGNTANPPIPLIQAHLHFEVGLILNARVNQWFRTHKLKNDHGNFNGWNLLGVDPLAVFERQRQCPDFDVFQYMATLPAAFEIVLSARRKPDYFNRYPCLWEGAPYRGAGLQLAVAEDGLPIKGRNATESERQLLGAHKSAILRVDPDALGRNGCHLVIYRKGLWRLGREGEKWRDMLMYY